MKKFKEIKKLIKLANHLDAIGQSKEADILDVILSKIAQEGLQFTDEETKAMMDEINDLNTEKMRNEMMSTAPLSVSQKTLLSPQEEISIPRVTDNYDYEALKSAFQELHPELNAEDIIQEIHSIVMQKKGAILPQSMAGVDIRLKNLAQKYMDKLYAEYSQIVGITSPYRPPPITPSSPTEVKRRGLFRR